MEKRAYTWQQPGQPWQLSPALVILLRSFVWAEHVGSLKQTRRLEDQPQVNEQKDWAKRVLSANPEPWLLLPRHSLPLLHSDPSLHTPLTACVFPSSGSRHSRNAKERSQLNVFHSLLLYISVSNTKQTMHDVLLLAGRKFQAKQLISSPPRTIHFSEQGRKIMSNYIVQKSSHWGVRYAKI